MLEQIGGECAGAVTFLPESEPLPEGDGRYREVDEMELAQILRKLPSRPLMAGEDGIRLSLAGAQDKIAVRLDNGRTSIPLDSAPSSHILKPAIAIFEGIVFNEAFCLALARGAGLDVANATVARAEDIDYLLIERFDRHRDADGNIVRFHQEDFCQALGFPRKSSTRVKEGPRSPLASRYYGRRPARRSSICGAYWMP